MLRALNPTMWKRFLSLLLHYQNAHRDFFLKAVMNLWLHRAFLPKTKEGCRKEKVHPVYLYSQCVIKLSSKLSTSVSFSHFEISTLCGYGGPFAFCKSKQTKNSFSCYFRLPFAFDIIHAVVPHKSPSTFTNVTRNWSDCTEQGLHIRGLPALVLEKSYGYDMTTSILA